MRTTLVLTLALITLAACDSSQKQQEQMPKPVPPPTAEEIRARVEAANPNLAERRQAEAVCKAAVRLYFSGEGSDEGGGVTESDLRRLSAEVLAREATLPNDNRGRWAWKTVESGVLASGNIEVTGTLNVIQRLNSNFRCESDPKGALIRKFKAEDMHLPGEKPTETVSLRQK